MAASVLFDETTGVELASALELADTPLTRMVGLLGRSALHEGQGMRFEPGGAIHTMFMRFSIDVIFLDRDDRVLKLVHSLRPWRFARAGGTRALVELPAGTLEKLDIHPGDVVMVRPPSEEPQPEETA